MLKIKVNPIIYPYSFIYLIGNFSCKVFAKNAKSVCAKVGVTLRGDFSQAYGWAFTGQNKSVVLINTCKPKHKKEIHTTVRHETQHACADLMEYIGHKPKADEEPLCYLNDFVYSKVMAKILKHAKFLNIKK